MPEHVRIWTNNKKRVETGCECLILERRKLGGSTSDDGLVPTFY